MDQPRVKDIINDKLLCVSPECLVSDAISKMLETKSSSVMIVDNNEVLGILTESDAVSLLSDSLKGKNLDDITVKLIMTSPVTCVGEDLNILEAMTIARDGQIRHVPVLNDADELIGVLNQTQIIQALTKLCHDNNIW